MRVYELFSGIGGMHFALKDAKIPCEIVTAIDISEIPNQIYRHNFPDTDHFQGNICGLRADKLNKLKIEAILMSPPCQPFTRQGHQKDVEDPRTQPLLHLISILPDLDCLQYILVENVKGFETSEARERLVETLRTKMEFHFQEFLISPAHLGIPNSRLRYYLIAKKSHLPFSFPTQEGIWTDLSAFPHLAKPSGDLPQLKEILETNRNLAEFELTDAILSKYAEVMDIVRPESSGSCCFTKSYGRYLQGTGSILQQDGDLDEVYNRFRATPKENVAEGTKVLRELKLRFFTPREIARLMGFPEEFSLPDDLRTIHMYRSLGNSLNVKVVSALLQLLMNKN